MKSILVGVGILAIASMTGCAHSLMRGTVAMKIDDRTAHLCMGEGEVKAGDKVTLFTSNCRGVGGGYEGGLALCTKVELGRGVIERVLNQHYSLLKVEPGVKFDESTFVEK